MLVHRPWSRFINELKQPKKGLDCGHGNGSQQRRPNDEQTTETPFLSRCHMILIAFVAKRRLRQTLMGPFVFQFFKRYKGQDTQTIILPISAFFLVLLMLKVFSCFLLLFYLLLCVTFYWIDTKNDTKNNKLSPGSFSGAMFGQVFFYIFFFYPFLKVSKHIL